ncbi:MAG TPA: hypothetical protein VL588_13075, partial [Bdellovibrionota bacterium]|nr:hypothetical protein [Bdellovibrionota bacterium]
MKQRKGILLVIASLAVTQGTLAHADGPTRTQCLGYEAALRAQYQEIRSEVASLMTPQVAFANQIYSGFSGSDRQMLRAYEQHVASED